MNLLQHDLGVKATNFTTELFKVLRGDVQGEFEALQERNFQAIELRQADTTDLGHVTVGKALIFDVLHGNNDGNDQQAMGIETRDFQVSAARHTKEIHHSANQSFGVTVRVARDPLEIFGEGDVRDSDRVKAGCASAGVRGRIIDFHETGEHGRQKMDTVLPEVLRLGDLQSHK